LWLISPPEAFMTMEVEEEGVHAYGKQ